MKNTQTVQTVYAAFGRGDIATILNHVSDNVDWDNSRVASKECPWNGNFSGKKNLPGFFKAVGENMDLGVFEPHTFVESGNHVVALLRIGGHIKKNHHAMKNDSVHVWTFNDQGLITGYRHYNDTAMELAAWRS